MNLFDRNRNDLSKYCYDLSKGVVLSFVALPIFQRTLNWHFGIAGFSVSIILLVMGVLLKEGDQMLTAYTILGVFGLCGIAFVLWYDYWYTPRHKKNHSSHHSK